MSTRAQQRGSYFVRVGLGCRNICLEVIFVGEVCGTLGEREVLRVSVLRLEVEVEITVNAEVQRVKVPERIASDETPRRR